MLLNPQQPLHIPAQDHLPLFFTHPHRFQTLQHLGNTADLVRIVADGQDLAGAGKAHGQFQRMRIEVDGVEEALLDLAIEDRQYTRFLLE